MRAADFNIQTIIDNLQGTCGNSIQSALDFYYPDMVEDDLTADDHYQLDSQIFVCNTCGWWCERGLGEDEDDNCEDCKQDEDD